MRKVPATEFKAKCLELMDRVAERRESFLITKRGKPVAKMGPVDRAPKDSIFGWLRGKAWIKGDILSPVVPPEAWEAVEEWRELRAMDGPQRSNAAKKRLRRRR
jgi:prevent-host-death family protein